MSEEVVIDFRATADFSQMVAETRAVQSSMEALRASAGKAIESVNRDIATAAQTWKSNLAAGGQFVTQNMALTSSADQFARSLQRGQLSYGQASRALKEYTSSATKAHTQLGRLIVQQELLKKSQFLATGRDSSGRLTGIMATPTGMSQAEMTKMFASSRTGLTQMARLSQVANQQLINLGKNAQWSGRQIMIGLTLPITLFGAAAGKAFYSLDQQLTNIVKVYGDLNTQMSGDQVKQLRAQITGLAMDLAKAWGTSSDVTLGVAQQMAAVGKQGADLIQSTREAVRLSTLGGVDSEQSMKTILSMQSAFKISTQDLADSINFLNAVENQTSATLEDFTQALPIAGPAVHALGGDIKELALMLVAMREGGISANQAANALKTSLGRLINPTKAAKDIVKGFGIDLEGIVQTTQGDPVKTVEALAKAMEPLTRLQKDQVMAKIFGLQQYSRMTALFDNINKKSKEGLASQTEEVKNLIDASAGELAGVANREIANIADSASGQFNRALESAKLALAGIGEQFLGFATGALKIVTPILNFFNDLPDPVKKGTLFATLFVAAIGPAKMLFGIMQNTVGTLRSMRDSVKFGVLGRGKINPDEAVTTAEDQARAIADKMGVLDQTFYDSAKATNVWTDSMNKLVLAMQNVGNTIDRLNGSGAIIQPAINSAVGRANMAATLMNRASGHTILPDVVEKELWGRLVGPTRTIPQQKAMNDSEKDKFGSLFGPRPGMSSIDPRTFAYGAAQASAFESLMSTAGAPTSGEVKDIIDMTRRNGRFAEMKEADITENIQQFYVAYEEWFNQLEAETARLAKEVETNLSRFKGMSEEEAEASLKQSLAKLNISWEKFNEVMNGRAYDVRSLAAQLDTHVQLGGGYVTARTGSAITDRFARAGQITSAMNSRGVPISTATLDEGISGFIHSIDESGVRFSRTVQEVSLQSAKNNFEEIRQRRIAADEAYQESVRAMNMEFDLRKKMVLYQDMLQKQSIATRLKSEQTTAEMEYKAAYDSAQALINGAEKAAVTLAAGGEAASKGGRLSSLFAGRGRSLVGGAGALMGVSMLATMIPRTENASINNGMDLLSGVGMGAGAGMMMGPYGAAIGAVVGGLITALPKVNEYLHRTEEASKAAFTTGETAASAFGAKLQSITDIQMNDMINKTAEIKSAYQQFLEGFKNAQDGSDDKKFIDALMGADENGLKELIRKRVVTSFAAGMKPDQVKAEVMAALSAAGKSGLGVMDMLDSSGMFDPKKSTNSLVKNAVSQMAAIRKEMTDQQPGLPTSWAEGSLTPGTKEYDEMIARQKEYQTNLEHMIATSDELQAALKGPADALVGFALSMKGVDFDSFIKNQNLAGISAESFAEYVHRIPGVSSDVTDAMDALATHGATTQQMLEAINLKSQGVIKTWGELTALPPAQLDIMLAINNTQVAITNDIIGPLLAKARSNLANLKKATILDAKQIQKQSKDRQDAWKAEQKAIQDRYNKEIDAIKKAEDARQKAFDAEQKRLDRLKQMRDFAISYREAIASGDMAGAAHIQNNMEITQAGWKSQDAADAAKAASDAKIAALEKERDAKVDAIQKAMDADEKATQYTLDNIDKINAARQKQNAAELKAAQDRVDALVALQNVPYNEENRAKIAAAAGLSGKQIGAAERSALIKEIGDSGAAIWDKISGDLSQAPWNLIGQLVDAKINGTGADVTRILKLIDEWNPAGPKSGKIGTGSLANKPLPYSTGGPVWGAGTATSDSINAKLSHGEFVMKAASVNKYGAAFMHAINEGRFASGGLVGMAGDRLAKRGLIDAVSSIVSGLFNPGTDAGRSNVPTGGLAQVIGSGIGATIAKWAEQFVGVPYSRTGSNPHDGWGCAPFVNYVYSHFGHPLPSATLSNAQFNGLHKGVNKNDLTAGDLVFFHYKNGVNVGNAVNHVGMALNGSSMIEAANPRAGTRISSIDWANYVGARRVLDPTGKAYRDGGLLMYGQGGEFMMNRNAVQTYGVDMMNAMNNRKFHTGGLVTAGGPVLDRGAGMSAGETNIHVYPGPGMDEECLADLVIQKIEIYNRRKGSGR